MSKQDESGTIDLPRRKILGAIGAVGVGSAAGGLGTSAFFSDTESFENNSITAGSLDLKVDWEEHYSDWSVDENDDRTDDLGGDESDTDLDGDGVDDFEVLMDEPTSNLASYTAFPPGTGLGISGVSDPLIWIPNEFVDDFMDNTSIDSLPDSDNDGIADFPIEDMNGRTPCEYLADVGGDNDGLDPDSDPLGRTDNEDTVDENGDPKPLISLDDVKPGDFGEVTFSTHLCDNPGYLWLRMPGGLRASENGLTEPEEEDPDEEDGVVEIVDEIQTAIWYDNNCDNLVTCEEKVDIMAVADTSQSIDGELDNADGTEEIDFIEQGANTFVSHLQANATSSDQIRAGLLTFNGAGDAGTGDPTVFDRPALRAGLGPLSQFDTDSDGNPDVGEFLPNEGNGNTPMPHAIDLAQKVLADQGRPDARQVILLVTDGLPDYTDDSSSTIPFTVEENEGGPLTPTGTTYTSEGYDGIGGNGQSDPIEQDETREEATEIQQDGVEIWVVGIGLNADGNAFLRDEVAGDDGDPTMAQPNFFSTASFDPTAPDDIDTIATQLAANFASGVGECDEVIFTGTLREAETVLTANSGRGIPLDANRDSAFDELNDPENDPARECFLAASTACFGFAWWLPVDHANQIQTDSVSFDIGFYTEQCRHNDGAGQPPEDDTGGQTGPSPTGTTGDGFGKSAAFEDDHDRGVTPTNPDAAWGGRLRYGGSGWNIGVFQSPINSGNEDTTNYDLGTSPFEGTLTVEYDASTNEASLTVDDGTSGTVVTTVPVPDQGDKLAFTGKANTSTQGVVLDNVEFNSVPVSGEDGLTAGMGSVEKKYLLVEDIDTATDWTITGDVTLEWDGTNTMDERPALDIDID